MQNELTDNVWEELIYQTDYEMSDGTIIVCNLLDEKIYKTIDKQKILKIEDRIYMPILVVRWIENTIHGHIGNELRN